MAYTHKDYPSKAALKRDLADGAKVTAYQPGPFGPDLTDGTIYLEGPHYPKPHRWYASATLKDGVIVPGSVK